MPQIQVVYSDDYLMVVNKPPGLVVTPADTTQVETLSDILQKEFKIKIERGGIVHRLDKDTSGLLLVAKTQESLENLQLQFKERMVKKEYLALVHGFLEKEGSIKGAIERNPQNREKFVVTSEGREAETRYKPVELLVMSSQLIDKIFEGFSRIQKRKLSTMNYQQFTLVRCFPLTGRTHQIRVHLKYIGFPIVGDEKYGGRKINRLDRRFCPRQFLHAAKIEFYHPKDGKKMVFEAELPEDLKNVLKVLQALNG